MKKYKYKETMKNDVLEVMYYDILEDNQSEEVKDNDKEKAIISLTASVLLFAMYLCYAMFKLASVL